MVEGNGQRSCPTSGSSVSDALCMSHTRMVCVLPRIELALCTVLVLHLLDVTRASDDSPSPFSFHGAVQMPDMQPHKPREALVMAISVAPTFSILPD